MLKLNLKARNLEGTNWSPDFAHDALDFDDYLWNKEYKNFEEIKNDKAWQSFAKVKKDDEQETVLKKIAHTYMYHAFDDMDGLYGEKLADSVTLELIDAETYEILDWYRINSDDEEDNPWDRDNRLHQ